MLKISVSDRVKSPTQGEYTRTYYHNCPNYVFDIEYWKDLDLWSINFYDFKNPGVKRKKDRELIYVGGISLPQNIALLLASKIVEALSQGRRKEVTVVAK